MILGTGIDIIEVDRIAEKIGKNQGFRELVFSPKEIAYCEKQVHSHQHYAGRFAAKEALSKAIGTGLRHPVNLTYVTVAHDGLGKPFFQFHPELNQLISDKGITRHHLTISDEIKMVCAFVILEK